MEFSATPPDAQARPSAPLDPTEYSVSIDAAAEIYAHAGHPRTIRRVQKYCARGDLDCTKVETNFGEKYMITRSSIDKHIAQIVDGLAASGRAPTRLDAPLDAPEKIDILALETGAPPSAPPAPERAPTRPDAGEGAAHVDYRERYIAQLESENKFLREQSTVVLERVKETNIISAKLQQMLAPLLGMGGTRNSPTAREVEEDGVIHTNQ